MVSTIDMQQIAAGEARAAQLEQQAAAAASERARLESALEGVALTCAAGQADAAAAQRDLERLRDKVVLG